MELAYLAGMLVCRSWVVSCELGSMGRRALQASDKGVPVTYVVRREARYEMQGIGLRLAHRRGTSERGRKCEEYLVVEEKSKNRLLISPITCDSEEGIWCHKQDVSR